MTRVHHTVLYFVTWNPIMKYNSQRNLHRVHQKFASIQDIVLDVSGHCKVSSCLLAFKPRCCWKPKHKLLNKQCYFPDFNRVFEIKHIMWNKPHHESIWKWRANTQNFTLNKNEILRLLSRKVSKSRCCSTWKPCCHFSWVISLLLLKQTEWLSTLMLIRTSICIPDTPRRCELVD